MSGLDAEIAKMLGRTVRVVQTGLSPLVGFARASMQPELDQLGVPDADPFSIMGQREIEQARRQKRIDAEGAMLDDMNARLDAAAADRKARGEGWKPVKGSRGFSDSQFEMGDRALAAARAAAATNAPPAEPDAGIGGAP